MTNPDTHPSADRLLLLAYGELPAAEADALHTHLAGCAACRDRLGALERPRAALDAALVRRRGLHARWIAAALAAAALLAAVFITASRPDGEGADGVAWPPPGVWSVTAGYIAGGRSVIEIDAQLTRLEQERLYGFPN